MPGGMPDHEVTRQQEHSLIIHEESEDDKLLPSSNVRSTQIPFVHGLNIFVLAFGVPRYSSNMKS
jgi:hypothetical protein